MSNISLALRRKRIATTRRQMGRPWSKKGLKSSVTMAENHQKKSQVIRFLPNCAHIGFDYQLIFDKSNMQSNLNFGAKIHIMRHFCQFSTTVCHLIPKWRNLFSLKSFFPETFFSFESLAWLLHNNVHSSVRFSNFSRMIFPKLRH